MVLRKLVDGFYSFDIPMIELVKILKEGLPEAIFRIEAPHPMRMH